MLERVALLIHRLIGKIVGSNLGPERAVLSEAFRGFAQSLHANSGIVHQIRPRSLRFISFPIHYSRTILPFWVIESVTKETKNGNSAFEILTAVAMKGALFWDVTTRSPSVRSACRLLLPGIVLYYTALYCVQVGGTVKHIVIKWFVYGEELLAPCPTPSWRTIPCRLSATTYSTYSQLPSISGGRLLYLQPKDAPCSGDKGPT
jgi:hypothetical protein